MVTTRKSSVSYSGYFAGPIHLTDMADRIEAALQESGAAYSVFDRDTIVPIGSDAERETLVCAFADVSASEFNGARAHLRNAGPS